MSTSAITYRCTVCRTGVLEPDECGAHICNACGVLLGPHVTQRLNPIGLVRCRECGETFVHMGEAHEHECAKLGKLRPSIPTFAHPDCPYIQEGSDDDKS